MSKQEVEATPPAYTDICTDPPASGYPQQPYTQQPYQQQAYPQQQYSTQQYAAQPYSGPQPYPGQIQQVGGQPVVITQQPMIVTQTQLSSPPNDYMGLSLFATFCCCWLIGIFAIMKSSECRSAIQRGDQNLALQKSAEAKRMVKLAIGFGILSLLVTFAILGVYIGVYMS